MSNIEAQHYKYNKKFECLDGIIKNLLRLPGVDKQQVSKLAVEINKLRIRYQEVTTSTLHEYYEIQSLRKSCDLDESDDLAFYSDQIREKTTEPKEEQNQKKEEMGEKKQKSTEKQKEEIQEEYNEIIISENLINTMDTKLDLLLKCVPANNGKIKEERICNSCRNEILDEQESIIKSILDAYNNSNNNNNNNNSSSNSDGQAESPDFNDNQNGDPQQTIIHYKELYQSTKIVTYTEVKRNTNKCDNCGKKMIVFPMASELRCSNCGNIMILQGIVFEDSQLYNQQVSGRAKKYSENAHCEKWLYRILAREKKEIPKTIITKLINKMKLEFSGNNARSTHSLKCEKIRSWLKECKISDYYNHAPLLRKILTSEFGSAVVPPQLSVAEIQIVLNEYSASMEFFQKIIKRDDILRSLDRTEIKNRFYYPYVLWKIFEIRFHGDKRLPGLLECIHLPSTETLKRNDTIWKIICKPENMNYKYKPTDRSVLSML